MTAQKKQTFPTAIQGILPCIFLFPLFLLLIAIAMVCSLFDQVLYRWEQKTFFLCHGRADA